MDNKTKLWLLLKGSIIYRNGDVSFNCMNASFSSEYNMQKNDMINIALLRDKIERYYYCINEKDDKFLDKLNYNELEGTLILQLKDYLEEKLEYIKKYTYIYILLYAKLNINRLYLHNNIVIFSNTIYDFNDIGYICNSDIFKISSYKENLGDNVLDFCKKDFIDSLDFSKNINTLLKELLDFYQEMDSLYKNK